MTQLEEAKFQKARLYNRYKEVKSIVMTTRDPKERVQQENRAKILFEMYQEQCNEVARLEGRSKEKTASKAKQHKRSGPVENLLNSGVLWSDIEGRTWSEMDGNSFWNDVRQSGRMTKLAADIIKGGVAKCTERQQEILQKYYVEKKNTAQIADMLKINKSTCCRTLHRALDRISFYISAKMILPRCINSDGYFDYMLFANSTRVLTERQREMLYMMLASDTSYCDISRYIERHRSVITRTADRVESRLKGLAIDLDIDSSSIRIKRSDWENVTEKELAERLGLSAKFYYHVVRRNEKINGIPTFYYVILKEFSAYPDFRYVSQKLGCSNSMVKKVVKEYGDIKLNVFIEPYNPVEPKKIKASTNPYAVFGKNQIIDYVDSQTYLKLIALTS